MPQGRFLWTLLNMRFQTSAQVGMKSCLTSIASASNGAETTEFALLRSKNLVTCCTFLLYGLSVCVCISFSHVAGSLPNAS